MAIRMPSQNKLLYYDTAEGGVSNDGWTALPSGGTGAGGFNLAKDLSIVNRVGFEMTSRKGTPYVYRCRVTLHGMTYGGTGAAVSGFAGDDSFTTLKLNGVANTWVNKNAAEEFHSARERMLLQAGVEKKSRGRYAHTIRYNYDAADDTWGTPVDGDGAAFTGGTWDVTKLQFENDSDFQLRLIGAGDDEETNEFSGTVLTIGHAYLLSRAQPPADTNPQLDELPAKNSALRKMLGYDASLTNVDDDIRNRARSEQDTPPYELVDISDSGDVHHDVTEPVELGRLTVGGADGYTASMIVDVPFGVFEAEAQHYSQNDENEVFNPVWTVEVLKISEMTG